MSIKKPSKKPTVRKKKLITKKEDRVIELLEEILDITRQSLWFNQRIVTWVFWQKIKGLVYLTLIAAPLIFAIFYLPPILESYINRYKDIISMAGSNNETITVEINSEHLNKIMELEKSGILMIDKK